MELNPNMKCSICFGLFVKTVALPCQDKFCLECIDTWIRKSHDRGILDGDATPHCPLCRVPFEPPPQWSRDHNMDAIVESYVSTLSEDELVGLEAMLQDRSERLARDETTTSDRPSDTDVLEQRMTNFIRGPAIMQFRERLMAIVSSSNDATTSELPTDETPTSAIATNTDVFIQRLGKLIMVVPTIMRIATSSTAPINIEEPDAQGDAVTNALEDATVEFMALWNGLSA